MRDELQKKESNIDRQTVKKEDNHDHNNLVSYQCIKYFTKFTKILSDSNYNTSGLSTGLASVYNYVCAKKNLNRTLAIDSPFQTYAVGLLVEFID